MELPLIGGCGVFMAKTGILVTRVFYTKSQMSMHQRLLGICISYPILPISLKPLGIVG